MDYFTKNKMLFWCVIVLVIVNIITLTTFWMQKPHTPPVHKQGSKQDGQALMAQRLGLTDEQAGQIAEIRADHFSRTKPLQDEMHQIRLELLDEIFADQPDPERINELLETLKNQLGEFEANLCDHFQQLKDVCTQEQVDELKTMLRDLIESTRPRPQGQPPHEREGMSGGHRPPHPPPRR